MAKLDAAQPIYPETLTGWLPTAITSMRVCFATAMVGAFAVHMRGGFIAAALLFIAAWATDVLDGIVARSLRMSSQIGSACDAAADRILCVTAVCLLIFSGSIDLGLGLAVICRELVADSLRAWLICRGHVAPHNVFGRVKFGCIAIGTVVGLLNCAHVLSAPTAAIAIALWLALLFGVASSAVVVLCDSSRRSA